MRPKEESKPTWDVFVSHNKKQKPWVREAVEQWRSLGLQVFFDEDSIEPGEPSEDGIERGVRGSRHIVLVLSPQSAESQWVALEVSLAIYADPDAKQRRLIPVILEPMAPEAIKSSIRRLNFVDLSDPETAEAKYHRLLKFLGVAATRDLPPLPGSKGRERRSRAPTPRIRSLRPSVWRGALIGLSCGMVAWLITLLPVFRGLEEWCQDGSFISRGRRASTAKVIVVGLDETSLEGLPKPLAFTSPELAEVVAYLHGRGAGAVGLDVMVPEDLDEFPGLKGQDLGVAAARAGNVVLPAMRSGDRLVRPLLVWRTGPPLGLVDLTEDPDHFLRRQQLAFRIGGEDYYQFAVSLLKVAGLVDDEQPDGRLRVRGRAVPLERGGFMRINFVGPANSTPSIPFHVVLNAARGGPPPAESLEEAIVIIGATARTLGDYHSTPYSNGNMASLVSGPSGLMSGPEVHANIVATLADGAFITTPWWLSSPPLVLLLGAALGVAFARLSLLHGAILVAAHHLAWRALSLAALALGPWRVEMVAMLLTGATCYLVLFAARLRLRGRLFGAAKSEAIARALEDDPGQRRLKGEERVLTVLFSDISGFTLYSEAHTPREVVALLNAYFGAVVPILEAHGATVDRYIGDGILALFNAPDAQPDHAVRAVRAAVEMVQRIHSLAPTWAAQGFPGMRIGVGVNTGPAVVGTIGSPRRLDYTAIGETVDAAARIESENRPQGTEVLVSAATYAAVPATERTRLGLVAEPVLVAVKGGDEPLPLHRAVAPDGPASPEPRQQPASPYPSD